MNLAEEIGRYLPGSGHSGASSDPGTAAMSAAVGGVLGSLFGGSSRNTDT
jgi:hypothetical protein